MNTKRLSRHDAKVKLSIIQQTLSLMLEGTCWPGPKVKKTGERTGSGIMEVFERNRHMYTHVAHFATSQHHAKVPWRGPLKWREGWVSGRGGEREILLCFFPHHLGLGNWLESE